MNDPPKDQLQIYYRESDFYEAQKTLDAIEKLDGKTIENYAAYIKHVLYVVRLSISGELYIYNYARGCYEKLEQWKIQILFKHLLNRAGVHWRTMYENEILGAYKRSVTEIVDAFDFSNELNFRNGVFNLETGILRPHDPKDTLFTTVLDYDYDAKAECPQFEKFILETACNDPELVSVLQEMFGYCCSVETGAEKAFFCYGTGANGKSLLGRVMTATIGPEYTCSVSLEGLDVPFALSSLIGKRLNIAGENENMPNSETLKSIISGESKTVHIKYKDPIEYTMIAKNVFLMNSLPKSKDISHGFFRKIMVLPFNNTVKPEDMDKDLYRKLLNERSGIFNWAFTGYRRLARNGFNFSKSKAVEKYTTDYINRENPVGYFFHSTYVANMAGRIRQNELYPDYKKWAESNYLEIMSLQQFFRALKLKAAEEDSGIVLNFSKSGDRYLNGYVRKNEKDNG